MTRLVGALPPFGGVFLFLSLSSEANEWLPGRNSSGIPTKTLSKVKHIARPACRQALKSLLHKVSSLATWAYAFFWSPPKPTASRSFRFLLVGSCSLLPALSLSPYDAPTPLPGEANLEALRMRVTHVARGKRQTRGKVQGVLRAPLPHSPPSQIVARPRATIPDNTQQQPRRHDNTLALSLGQTRRPCSPFNIRSRPRNPAA